MLSEKFFTDLDRNRIEKKYNFFKKVLLIIIFIVVPLDFLIAYVVSLKVAYFFWPILLINLLLVALLVKNVFLKSLNQIKNDLNEQIKLVGEVLVSNKSESKNNQVIFFSSAEISELNIDKNAYNKIEIGDTLTLEIAKNSETIFRLIKSGEILINGS